MLWNRQAGVIGAAGSVITPFFPISPTVGSVFIMTAFIVVVLGGLGSFWGALLGGLVIGLAESIEATYHPGAMQQFVTYIIFILTLLFRPAGLLGERVHRFGSTRVQTFVCDGGLSTGPHSSSAAGW